MRYAGVLGPRSAWRKGIVPKPRERRPACNAAVVAPRARDSARPRAEPKRAREGGAPAHQTGGRDERITLAPEVIARPGDVIALAPNVLSMRHWDRVLGGALYAATPRVPWADLLRRNFAVDVMACAKCGGRIRVLGVIIERESVRRILAHLGLPTESTPPARARDPTDDLDDIEPVRQLDLGPA